MKKFNAVYIWLSSFILFLVFSAFLLSQYQREEWNYFLGVATVNYYNFLATLVILVLNIIFIQKCKTENKEIELHKLISINLLVIITYLSYISAITLISTENLESITLVYFTNFFSWLFWLGFLSIITISIISLKKVISTGRG